MYSKLSLSLCCLAAANFLVASEIDSEEENLISYQSSSKMNSRSSETDSPVMKPHHLHYELYGDFLYWKAANGNAPTGIKNRTDSVTQTLFFQFDWDVGFRIGADFKTTWEDVTFDINWTKFHAHSTNTHQSPEVLTTLAGYPNYVLYGLPISEYINGSPWKIRSTYKIEYNQIDFSFRKALMLSKNFTLSPFGGLRAIITEHTLNSTEYAREYGSTPATIEGPFNTSTSYNKDYIKAIGLLGGFMADMKLGYGFGFYFGGDMFIGYGGDKTYSSTVTFNPISTSAVDKQFQRLQRTRTMYDLFTGFSWDKNFWDDKMNFLLSAGYEFHVLTETPQFEYFYSISGSDQGLPPINQPSGPTTFQGLTIRAGIGF